MERCIPEIQACENSCCQLRNGNGRIPDTVITGGLDTYSGAENLGMTRGSSQKNLP